MDTYILEPEQRKHTACEHSTVGTSPRLSLGALTSWLEWCLELKETKLYWWARISLEQRKLPMIQQIIAVMYSIDTMLGQFVNKVGKAYENRFNYTTISILSRFKYLRHPPLQLSINRQSIRINEKIDGWNRHGTATFYLVPDVDTKRPPTTPVFIMTISEHQIVSTNPLVNYQ